MSIGFSSGFYEPFKDVVKKQFFIPFPDIWNGKNDIETIEKQALDQADRILDKNLNQIAAIIIEPLIQGAAGIEICRDDFLNKLLKKGPKTLSYRNF